MGKASRGLMATNVSIFEMVSGDGLRVLSHEGEG